MHICFLLATVFRDHPLYGIPSSKSNAEHNTTSSMTQPRPRNWRVPYLGRKPKRSSKEGSYDPSVQLWAAGLVNKNTQTQQTVKTSGLCW